MSSTMSAISVQIDSKDKEQITPILQKLGITMSGLINMTIKQVIMREAVPFPLEIPKEKDDIYKYFSKEELEETAKELEYIKTHLNEYKENNRWEDLKAELSNEKI